MKKLMFIILASFVFQSVLTNRLNAQTLISWNNEHPSFNFFRGSSPFIEFNLGMSKPNHKLLNSTFANTGLAELKLGYQKIDSSDANNILRISNKFIFVSNISTNLSTEKSSRELKSNLWRFGIGQREGYGYKSGSVTIFPYYQYAFVWSQPKLNTPDKAKFKKDYLIIDRINNNIRFGTSTEGGITIGFGKLLSLDVSYETSVIFPRYLFFKQSGSLLTEAAGQALLNNFINNVIKSSPAAGPIVYFVLKNALSYAFYSLKRDKMNWPFSSEAPLTYKTFKVGLMFTF